MHTRLRATLAEGEVVGAWHLPLSQVGRSCFVEVSRQPLQQPKQMVDDASLTETTGIEGLIKMICIQAAAQLFPVHAEGHLYRQKEALSAEPRDGVL